MADPIHQFVIKPIIPLELAGFDVSFTNSSMWMAIGVVLASSFLMLAASPKAMIPGRMQAFAEMMYEFVINMIKENTGKKGMQYFPFIFTLFVVLLMGNVLGLIPYSFTYTSHIIVTFALASVVFLMITFYGFLNNGLHFLTLFSPPGIPFLLKFIIVPIELMSFLTRPITLSVRLFANMMAGHLILKVFAGFCTMLASVGAFGVIAAFVPVFLNVALLALELLVALLQAYIFTVLSCVYLRDTVDLHH